MIEPKSQRDYCIKELVETERNYVDALQMLIRVSQLRCIFNTSNILAP